MKKALLIAAAALLTSICAMAQAKIELPYSKMIAQNDGKWESWPEEWEDANKEYQFVPSMTIKKIDDDIFTIAFDFGGRMVLTENVVYDPIKTAEIRKKNSNNTLTAYRSSGSKDYVWTENITLAALYSTPSKWKTTPNAQIYTINPSLGSSSLYRVQLPAQPAKKYTVHFKSTSKLVKGTWTNWSSWSTAPQNSYFELKVVTEGRAYNFKYYENGKLVKNYDITYNDQQTKSVNAENKKAACYKINGTKDDWIYLMNTTMRTMYGNPDKWSENDAEIYILDDEKTGYFTRVK